MKIAIEGMDGVGKTTVAKILSKKLDYEYINKPLRVLFGFDSKRKNGEFEKLSRIIMDINDPVIKAWFFGLGNLYSIRKCQTTNLIIDRHFVSNYFWNGNNESNIIYRTLLKLAGKPDITILLRASTKKRMERMHNRDSQDFDLFDKEKHVYGYDKMINFLDDYHLHYVSIDTETKNIQEVCRECIDIINQHKTNNPRTTKGENL